MKNIRLAHLLTLLLALMLLSSCATTSAQNDPLEPVNRATDTLNDGIDRLSLKPVAQGYSAAVPKPMRTAISNFYDNATSLNTVLNDFLQGKAGQGMQDFMRFLINTILGAGGLVDVASSMGLERHEEDFGQTLAVWGISQGPYIVYPLMGPNSARNTTDFLTATATDPLFWAGFVLAPYITIPATVLKYIDKRARLLDASDMRDELALDPYVFTREAWQQNREYKIHDGNPPTKTAATDDDGWEEDDDWGEDDWGEGDGNEESASIKPSIKQPVEQKSVPKVTEHKAQAFRPKTRISLAEPVPEIVSSQAAASQSASPQAVPASADLSNMQIDNATSGKAAGVEAKVYVIYLSSHASEVEAAAEQGRLARQNILTNIYPVTLHERTWYRLRASQHSSKSEANAHLEKLKLSSGLTGAWIEIMRP